MNTKVYVGNLSYGLEEEALQTAFEECGSIREVKIITDRESGRSKGFGFVTFEDEDGMKAALEKNGQELDGRALKVNEAKEQENRGGFRNGGGGGRSQNRNGSGGGFRKRF